MLGWGEPLVRQRGFNAQSPLDIALCRGGRQHMDDHVRSIVIAGLG